MATYTTEIVTSTVHRWIVPAAEPWGAAAGEITKAWAAAETAYRKYHGIDPGQALYDDALRFRVGDDEIIIEFATEVEEDR